MKAQIERAAQDGYRAVAERARHVPGLASLPAWEDLPEALREEWRNVAALTARALHATLTHGHPKN